MILFLFGVGFLHGKNVVKISLWGRLTWGMSENWATLEEAYWVILITMPMIGVWNVLVLC